MVKKEMIKAALYSASPSKHDDEDFVNLEEGTTIELFRLLLNYLLLKVIKKMVTFSSFLL